MIDWLQFLYATCTSEASPSNWREISIAANASIALAYFWIPAVMAVVFARWREELPYRRLWIGFVIFITACGLSHVVHAFHALQDQSPHAWPELAVMIGTAGVSLATAALFTYLLPTILRLASPAEARRKLESAVQSATADLQTALNHERLLLREVHHRVKNNLQVTASLVNLHMRNTAGPTDELRSLRDRISAMASVHTQLQDVGSTTLRVRRFVESLILSMREAKVENALSMGVEGDDFEVQLDHATSFALIMHEVLANAMHSAIAPEKATLSVKLARDGTRRSVTVDGPGLCRQSGPKGVGKTLVKALAVQLNARVEWEYREGTGQFHMEFEDDQPYPTRVVTRPMSGGLRHEVSSHSV